MENVRRFVMFALVVALAGCSGTPTTSAGGNVPSTETRNAGTHSWISPDAATGDLLYISDDGYGSVLVYAYTPRTMKFVGVLAAPINPGSMCVDRQQNIWIVGEHDGNNYSATEYAHGGTSPIAVVTDPAGVPTGCAVDPTNGDLALGSAPPLSGGEPTIAIFKNGRGKPKLYHDTSIKGFYNCCTYDHRGNLYAYGTENQYGVNIIEVLPKGSSTFTSFTLDHEIPWLYGMQWVGKYFTVADSNLNTDSKIDEYTVSSGTATLAGTIPLKGVTLLWQYFIDRNRVIAPNAPFEGSGSVGIYNYPSGDAIRVLPFSEPVAAVVSRAPKT
jgi:hypothetical protein